MELCACVCVFVCVHSVLCRSTLSADIKQEVSELLGEHERLVLQNLVCNE